MNGPHRWPLSRWADRDPLVRWPLVLLLLLLLWGLAGWLEQTPI